MCTNIHAPVSVVALLLLLGVGCGLRPQVKVTAATPPTATEPTGGDDVLSADAIQEVRTQKFSLLSGCLREEVPRTPGVKKIELDFIIKGTGSVSSVRINGQTSSPVVSCVVAKMQAITFPECKTCSKTHASFSLTIK
jgi:hypothetical protein